MQSCACGVDECAFGCDREGYSPVHACARWGRLLLLRMLEDDFEENIELLTPNGRTPLHVAAAFGQVDQCIGSIEC